MKPLFIPLKKQYFEQFSSGKKREEFRRYGPRWSETQCGLGRPVTLSCGYGKQRRLNGKISSFSLRHGQSFSAQHKADIEQCYGTLDIWISCIGIEIDGARTEA